MTSILAPSSAAQTNSLSALTPAIGRGLEPLPATPRLRGRLVRDVIGRVLPVRHRPALLNHPGVHVGKGYPNLAEYTFEKAVRRDGLVAMFRRRHQSAAGSAVAGTWAGISCRKPVALWLRISSSRQAIRTVFRCGYGRVENSAPSRCVSHWPICDPNNASEWCAGRPRSAGSASPDTPARHTDPN